LKARVDLGDQTVEFIPFEVISTAISMYFYPLLGTNVRILVSVINTRFQPDAPRRCIIQRKPVNYTLPRHLCRHPKMPLLNFEDWGLSLALIGWIWVSPERGCQAVIEGFNKGVNRGAKLKRCFHCLAGEVA